MTFQKYEKGCLTRAAFLYFQFPEGPGSEKYHEAVEAVDDQDPDVIFSGKYAA